MTTRRPTRSGLIDESTAEDKSTLDGMALGLVRGRGRAAHPGIRRRRRAEWIKREQDRLNRRWRDWERDRPGNAAVTGRPWPLSIGPGVAAPE
jgi:hypothetical protein